MEFLPSANQIKKADAYTIEELGVPSLELMERAAMAVVRMVKRQELVMDKIVIVCGSGNNGGDGFAIGRLLLEEGRDVELAFVGNKDHCTKETKEQIRRFEAVGGRVETTFEKGEYSAVVDAVFGVGLNREIQGNYKALIEAMNESSGLKVAVDIPSGVCATTGKILGVAFKADVTVTFERRKSGLLFYPGHFYCGEIFAADIGIDCNLMEKSQDVLVAYDQGDLGELLPKRSPDSHKGSYGRVLMISGCKGMAGAAYLAAYASYMTGAGLVRIYTPEENRTVLQQLLPEAIISPYENYNEVELEELLSWADVVCIGSGIGKGEISVKIMEKVLKTVKRLCVIDADGINIIAEHPELGQLMKEGEYILTPHIKEMSGLIGRSVREIKNEPRVLLEQFTKGNQLTCVLKDARSLTSKEGCPTVLNLSGNESMAKAGSGDVLAGIITGLLAQGSSSYVAASLGAYIHGCAGDLARKKKGNYSVMARDLIENLGRVLDKEEY